MTIFLASEKHIAAAADALRRGEVIGLPTETVYGLAADATNDRAVAEIYAAKGRPSFNPLIVHVASAQAAQLHVVWNALADSLAAAFWPGPLTLVLPRRADSPLSLLVSAGLDSVAIRVPAHPVARAVLEACDVPLAAPSANPSGRISPTAAAHVEEAFPELLILDGRPCQVGLESTVIDCTGAAPVILRPGVIGEEQLQAAGCRLQVNAVDLQLATNNQQPKSPGLLLKHYAPRLPLRLNVTDLQPGEALLAFGPQPLVGAVTTYNLSETSDMVEAAANLFAMLRALDNPAKHRAIAVMPIPRAGIGLAIHDRLERAARG